MGVRLTLAVLLGGLLSCSGALGRRADADASGLRVFAAASLRDLLEDTQGADELPLRISTGGSGLIAEQLLAGAQADVFISAGEAEVERLVEAGLARREDVRLLFRNRLVVIAPAGAPKSFEPADLASAGRVSLAHPKAVPAGRYARRWLEEEGLWEAVAPRVVQGLDVRAALAAVASGGADYGIVYASDAARFDSVEVVYRVPDGEGPRIVYPGVVLAASHHPEAARSYLRELADPAGRWATAVRKEGFLPGD